MVKVNDYDDKDDHDDDSGDNGDNTDDNVHSTDARDDVPERGGASGERTVGYEGKDLDNFIAMRYINKSIQCVLGFR